MFSFWFRKTDQSNEVYCLKLNDLLELHPFKMFQIHIIFLNNLKALFSHDLLLNRECSINLVYQFEYIYDEKKWDGGREMPKKAVSIFWLSYVSSYFINFDVSTLMEIYHFK